ncbi:MAG: hypothetical protein Q7T82_04490 [Armatimonadota bacterium]|nr:hypothetical protein [Armatimonadota bacterium]
MAICDDCAHRRHCTFPRTESTRFCDEHDSSEPQVEQVEWDLSAMLTDWGYRAQEA